MKVTYNFYSFNYYTAREILKHPAFILKVPHKKGGQVGQRCSDGRYSAE